MSEPIEIKATLEKIIFPKGLKQTDGEFAICSFSPTGLENIKDCEIELDEKYLNFKVKGHFPPNLRERQIVELAVIEGQRNNYGLTYELSFAKTDFDLDKASPEDIKNFLESFLTKRQVENLYKEYEDPFVYISNQDIDALKKVKGIGLKTASTILDNYNFHKDYGKAYIELAKYEITPKIIRKIVHQYKSVDLAIEKILENPYQLMSLDGFGFIKCDHIFKSSGRPNNDPIRINGLMEYILNEELQSGNTYIDIVDFSKKIKENTPTVEFSDVGKVIQQEDSKYVLAKKDDNDIRVSLKSSIDLERKVATEIMRLKNSKPYVKIQENWLDIIRKNEEKQGWKYTEGQVEAMKGIVENNIFLLQGLGGTGKTTLIKDVLKIFESRYYSYAQCALSGRASNNLAMVTGKAGSTIHRLLGLGMGENMEPLYSKKNPLPYDIVIIDEVSMVNANIFYQLTSAIKSGAKLIMLGDIEQLESIGIPVMSSLINPDLVPTITLTEVHRQALKSAIIIDSIKIRNGENPLTSTEGTDDCIVHGELEDLEYHLHDSDTDILHTVLQKFHEYVNQGVDIKDIQILSATKTGGSSCHIINMACQKIYNPMSDDKKEVETGIADKKYMLRVGDKVINVSNNYSSKNVKGNIDPIFNGNIGIVRDFVIDENNDEFMIVDFEGYDEYIMIPKNKYKNIELGYAITIHKSQGSGFNNVIIALPFHYMLNSKQLLYTAVTRTIEHCVLASSYRNIQSAIRKNHVIDKKTYLREILQEDFEQFELISQGGK